MSSRPGAVRAHRAYKAQTARLLVGPKAARKAMETMLHNFNTWPVHNPKDNAGGRA